MNGNICKKNAAAMNHVWKDTYLQSFAIIFLHEQDNAERWRQKLQNAKYYHSMFSDNAVLICNIRYEDAEKEARQNLPRTFLYGECMLGRISVRYMKWGILVKNKGRLRRGYFQSRHAYVETTQSDRLDASCALLLSEFGLTLDVSSGIIQLIYVCNQIKDQRTA